MERGLRPWQERWGLLAWGYVANRPGLYALVTRIGARVMARMGGRGGRIARLPLAGKGWTATRDMPAPSGKTFRELYRQRKEKR
jgi:L-lactate dehydrogenase complex protein LldF